MIIQWILQILAGTIVGCVIGFFLIRIFTKIRYKKRSDKINKKIDICRKERFYIQFGFYYEDLIKYAPELDVFLSSQINPLIKDNINIKMIKFERIYDAICTVEQVDIIKFKQTIENIKNQKLLENIDG